MFEFSENLMYTLAVFVAASYILYTYKHPKMFDEKGDFRRFGLKPGDTVFPYWLVTLVIALASYTFFVTRGVNFV
jgi:hypothetical protein